ncbi:MAG: recombinase family protein [Lachnospiraceae bacterium]|nr:recombinase family protein [Lachnospiraceae bacterium]
MQGHHPGGVPPIGYKVENKKLVIDEDKAHIIQFAFEQYAAGVPKKQIMKELTTKGVTNSYGRPLTCSCLQNNFRNKKYIGVYVYDGFEIPDGCPPLVDEDTFHAVQERLDAKKRAPAAGKANYLLQGKAYCGACGARMIGESGRGRHGATYHYYTCGERKRGRGCAKKNEKKGFLEWYVAEQTAEYVLRPDCMKIIASRVIAVYNEEFSDDKIKALERRLLRVDAEANKAVDASIAAPAKGRQRYYDKLEQLETQKADIEIDLARLRIANDIRYTEEHVIAWLKTFCRGEETDLGFQRRIIDVFINSVYVYDDKIVIYYNIKDGKQITVIDELDSCEEPPFGGNPDICNGVRISDGLVDPQGLEPRTSRL